MTTQLEDELAYRAVQGFTPRTVAAITVELAALGYKLDRTLDCRSSSRYMTGERAGQIYPCVTTGVKEADTGLSFANFEARRDANYRALQDLRRSGSCFAVSRGAILEI